MRRTKFRQMCIITTFCILATPPTLVASQTSGQRGEPDDEDFFLTAFLVVAAAVSLGSIIYNALPEDHAKVTVQAVADGADTGPMIDIASGNDRVASKRASIVGPLGSTAVAALTVTNPVSHAPTFDLRDTSGVPAQQVGAFARSILTGEADGNVIISQEEMSSGPTTILSFNYDFSTFDFALGGSALPGDGLSMDLGYLLSSSAEPYEWGFSVALDNFGELAITDRRGMFSDTDIIISGKSILDVSPPSAEFEVPFDTNIDVSGTARFEGIEHGVPAPGSVALLGLTLWTVRRRRASDIAIPASLARRRRNSIRK